MKKFREFINEAMRVLSDEKTDNFISNNWDNVITYSHNPVAAIELAKLVDDVIVTKDRRFILINGDLGNKLDKVKEIATEFGLTEYN